MKILLTLACYSAIAGAAVTVEEDNPLRIKTNNITIRPAQFMSMVQMLIHETDPAQVRRSQKLVLEQMNQGFRAFPQLSDKRFEIRTVGNEVVFSLVTEEDMRQPMQEAVASMIQSLNGRVRARGRSQFYLTNREKKAGGYLEVAVNDQHNRVRSISAQSVPLRDLLKELKSQLGELSYLIPGECADRLVDWSFKEPQVAAARHVDSVISDLATLFSLKAEKKNGTYIFTGNCPHPFKRSGIPETEVLTAKFFPPEMPAGQPTQVYFPLPPLME